MSFDFLTRFLISVSACNPVQSILQKFVAIFQCLSVLLFLVFFQFSEQLTIYGPFLWMWFNCLKAITTFEEAVYLLVYFPGAELF